MVSCWRKYLKQKESNVYTAGGYLEIWHPTMTIMRVTWLIYEKMTTFVACNHKGMLLQSA